MLIKKQDDDDRCALSLPTPGSESLALNIQCCDHTGLKTEVGLKTLVASLLPLGHPSVKYIMFSLPAFFSQIDFNKTNATDPPIHFARISSFSMGRYNTFFQDAISHRKTQG